MRSRSLDIIRGLAALTLLAGLLVAVPWALVTQVGSPFPTAVPSWEQFSRSLTRGDLDDWTIIKALALLVWLAWGQVAANVIAEAAAMARRRPSPRIPGAAPLRSVAANLVAAVAVLVSTLSRPSAAPAEAMPMLQVALAAAPADSASAAQPAALAGPSPNGRVVASGEADGDAVDDSLPRWTVQQRDTLWDIAEHALGDGLRWREIHRLNAGRIQPDGGRLGEDGHVQVGWILVLPADATVTRDVTVAPGSQLDASATETIVVEQGDTLWDLSRDHLEDPRRWPELYEENRGDPQPDGRQLTDPDLIQPGWVLQLPGHDDGHQDVREPDDVDVPEISADVEASGNDPSASTLAPPSEEPRAEAGPDETSAIPPRLERDAAAGEEPMPEQLQEDGVADRVAAMAGVALTAAGVAATLDRIRRSRRRRRQPGERVPMPEGSAASTELRIRGLAVPADADRIDTAMRLMAIDRHAAGLALPAVVLVSVSTRELALHLAKPDGHPPDGWRVEDGGLTWVLGASAEILTADAETRADSPAPILVTVGTTAEGKRRVMLNLGHVGRLSVQAPVEVRRHLLLHMALELATTGRAHALDIVVHGFGGSLSPLERIRFCAEAEELVQLVGRAASDATDAGFIPTVGLSTESLDMPVEVVLEGGVALVSGDDAASDWTLREQGGALHLAPAGLVLEPLELTPDELELVGELVLQAKQAPTVAIDDDAEPDRPGNDHEQSFEDVIDLTLDVPAVREERVEVKILGTVEVDGAVDLTSAKAEEFIVYLATHRKGATLDELQEALWPEEEPSSGRLHTTAWRARQSLGDGPDSEPLLPKVVKGRYALSTEVGVDYERFRAHVARARVAPSSAIDELRAALDLVLGEPYAGTATEYTWASFEVHAIAQAIGDAAHWLARLYLDANQPAEARWAAEQGLRADPYLEALYRDLMESAAAESNIAEVEIIMKRLRGLVADEADHNDADDRLDPETLRCYDVLTSAVGHTDRVGSGR